MYDANKEMKNREKGIAEVAELMRNSQSCVVIIFDEKDGVSFRRFLSPRTPLLSIMGALDVEKQKILMSIFTAGDLTE